jgi:hypothetical protein
VVMCYVCLCHVSHVWGSATYVCVTCVMTCDVVSYQSRVVMSHLSQCGDVRRVSMSRVVMSHLSQCGDVLRVSMSRESRVKCHIRLCHLWRYFTCFCVPQVVIRVCHLITCVAHRLSINRPTKRGKEKSLSDGHCPCEKEMDDHLLACQQIFESHIVTRIAKE